MSNLKQQFDRAVADSKNLPERPGNITLLRLYALYKQASSGDASGERPSVTDLIARTKWDAWHALHGTPEEQAMEQYIALVEELKG